jgi:glycosyltransferase involved in cell wall biosynthesis
MKIILIGNYQPAGQQSMERFVNLLARLLTEAGHRVSVLRPRSVFGTLLSRPSKLAKWLGYIDQYLLFPPMLRKAAQDADLVHICDHSNAMYLAQVQHKPHLITCHDLFAIRAAHGDIPERRVGLSGRIQQNWVAHYLAKARNIVCVSEQTRRELLETINSTARNVSVIHTSLQPVYYRRPPEVTGPRLAALGLTGQPFFLHVGGNQWYKNRRGVLELFHHLRQQPGYAQYKMVMVGQSLTPELRQLRLKLNLQERVHEMVNLPDENLSILYQYAEALLFPSLSEGAGWPPLEAQACGCPVAISNLAPLNELTPLGAAIFIDPANLPQAAEYIASALHNRQALIEAGQINAARYSEKSMVKAYLEAYQVALTIPA